MIKPRKRVSAVLGRDLTYVNTKIRILSELHLIRVLYVLRKCGYHYCANRGIVDLKFAPFIYVNMKGNIGKGVDQKWFEQSTNREVFIE